MASIPTQGTLLIDTLAVIVVGYLAVRQFREKETQVSRLWITPALTLLISYTSIQSDLFDTALSPAIIGAGFAIGLVVGGVRGRATRLKVNPARGVIVVRGTVASVVLWVALLAVKAIADGVLASAGKSNEPAGIAAGLVTATLLAFSLGAIIATPAYFYWRYSLAAAETWDG